MSNVEGTEVATVSAIVVNYNAGELLCRCIESIRDQVDEIIIVDNASLDNSVDKVKQQFADTNIQYILNWQNSGFAAACNTGARKTGCEYLLFINPDCVVDRGGVQKLLAVITADSNVACVGGMLLNPDGSEQRGGRCMVPTPWRSFVKFTGLTYLSRWWPDRFADFQLYKQPIPECAHEVDIVSGACMLIRHAQLRDVGYWDERYFLYCEDLDLCMRFKNKGLRVLLEPAAKIWHRKEGCSNRNVLKTEWHKHRGMLLFNSTYFKDKSNAVLMLVVKIGIALNYIKSIALRLVMKKP